MLMFCTLQVAVFIIVEVWGFINVSIIVFIEFAWVV